MQEDYSIAVAQQKDDVVVTFKGTFYKSIASDVVSLLEKAIDRRGVFFFFDITKASFDDECYLKTFVELLNSLKKRSAKLIFIGADPESLEYFSRYSAIFDFADSRKAFHKQELIGQLKQVGLHYTKKTGIRLTPSVAIIFTLVLLGWFLTLVGIIYTQNRELAERRAQVILLESEVKRSMNEIERLQASIGPLQNLGLLGSATEERSTFATVRDWMHYLDRLDSTRREN